MRGDRTWRGQEGMVADAKSGPVLVIGQCEHEETPGILEDFDFVVVYVGLDEQWV